MTIVYQRCFHHSNREAVARCPECKRFFCRECITEHEGRVVCADCIRKLAAVSAPRFRSRAMLRGLLFLLSFLVVWLYFVSVARTLINLPDAFHEDTFYSEPAWDDR